MHEAAERGEIVLDGWVAVGRLKVQNALVQAVGMNGE
jgi:hypothetical protein